MSFLTKMQFMFENLFNRVTRLIPSASGKILYNKWVLYFIFVIGIYDVIHFYQRGNIMAVAIFFIVGFLTAFFSKNMIVVIVSAIAVSHIVAYGNKMTEGLTEGNKKEDDEDEGFAEGADGKEEEEEGFVEGADGKKEEEEDEGFAEGADGEDEDDDKKEKNDKKEKDTFSQNIEKMQNLLNKTEKMVNQSKQEGFSPIRFAEYK
jgi:hypothetical protein